MKQRIAILFHAEDRRRDLSCYIIFHLAEIWRELGFDVVFVFGVDEFIPADVAILHIDLSVIPDEYLKFSDQYPITLNRCVVDIRKSTLSDNLVQRDNDYDGSVIVKSNLNNAGIPEHVYALRRASRESGVRQRLRKWLRIIRSETIRFESALDYQVYNHICDVPRSYFHDPGIVVEKFMPERHNEHFFLRVYHFLGNRDSCTRMTSLHPIVTAETVRATKPVEPHPEIVALRHSLGFDYGKFDYVIHDEKPILLDTNKTTGRGSMQVTAERLKNWRHRAEGIYAYL